MNLTLTLSNKTWFIIWKKTQLINDIKNKFKELNIEIIALSFSAEKFQPSYSELLLPHNWIYTKCQPQQWYKTSG